MYMKRYPHRTVLLCTAALFANQVFADGKVSGYVSVLSKYMWSGGDQNFYEDKAFDPAIQLSIFYSLDNGFYVGNWASTTHVTDNNRIDATTYIGHSDKLGPGIYDLSIGYNYYPGAPEVNTTYIYAMYYWNKYTFKYATVISDKWFGYENGFGRQSVAVEMNHDLNSKIHLKGEVGRLMYPGDLKAIGFKDKAYYLVQADYKLQDNWKVSAAVTGAGTIAGQSNGWTNKDRFVLSVTKSF